MLQVYDVCCFFALQAKAKAKARDGRGTDGAVACAKTTQAALLLDHRRRVCAVEFLVAQVDQVRAGRKARALWATCPPLPLPPLERQGTRNLTGYTADAGPPLYLHRDAPRRATTLAAARTHTRHDHNGTRRDGCCVCRRVEAGTRAVTSAGDGDGSVARPSLCVFQAMLTLRGQLGKRMVGGSFCTFVPFISWPSHMDVGGCASSSVFDTPKTDADAPCAPMYRPCADVVRTS